MVTNRYYETRGEKIARLEQILIVMNIVTYYLSGVNLDIIWNNGFM